MQIGPLRSEHPRPDLQRERWLSLNGPWRFAFDPDGIGEQERWHRPGTGRPKDLTIQVPFPWESRLSGVAAPSYQDAGWYEREISIPAEWSDYRPYLCFGAVDWSARVWLNGRLIAEHENGYLPFAIDLSEWLEPGQSATLTVRAFDVGDAATLLGKQVACWYTHTSGIWQSVWLEARGQSYVNAVRIEPDLGAQLARVTLDATVPSAETFILRLTSPDNAFPPARQRFDLGPGRQTLTMELPIPSPRLWSPESPFLYRIDVHLDPVLGGACDRFQTYFGMRSIGRGAWNGREYENVLLNGEPIYLRGALDQAFHPDGIYTYPTDERIRADLALARELGLNLLRCHIKICDDRINTTAAC
jgi:beta-galactosidase/beta-glucuronidase